MTGKNEKETQKELEPQKQESSEIQEKTIESVQEVLSEDAQVVADPVEEEEGTGQFTDRVVHINRVAKVVKGGRRFSFSALVVCGDGQGQVGFGLGKANEVPEAIRKASEKARRSMIQVPMMKRTIPHDTVGEFGAARVILKRASAGTGVIAGGPVRAIFEAAGVHDILTKSIGTNNAHNVLRATMHGIQQLKDPKVRRAELASVE